MSTSQNVMTYTLPLGTVGLLGVRLKLTVQFHKSISIYISSLRFQIQYRGVKGSYKFFKRKPPEKTEQNEKHDPLPQLVTPALSFKSDINEQPDEKTDGGFFSLF